MRLFADNETNKYMKTKYAIFFLIFIVLLFLLVIKYKYFNFIAGAKLQMKSELFSAGDHKLMMSIVEKHIDKLYQKLME